MIDITHKSSSLRKAIASAVVKTGSADTIKAIKNGSVPKGNVMETARVAALFAVKRTSDMIPDCHPLPIEFTDVRFELSETEIQIQVEVHTIYKTGVEVEAMHGASIAALTIYDMLKPIDKQVEIASIRLVSKSGGKSDYRKASDVKYTAAVIVCSDSIFAGKKEDKAGKAVIAKLEECGVAVKKYEVIPDEMESIRKEVNGSVADELNILIISGGTGLSPRDVTPEVIKPMLEREIPGIMETARSYGQQRMPYAMLSRGVAGFIKNTLVITVPGSTRGAQETMEILFPYVLHLFFVKKGKSHDEG